MERNASNTRFGPEARSQNDYAQKAESMKIFSLSTVLMIVFACFFGCSGTTKMVTPSYVPLGPADIKSVDRSGAVTLINAQPSAIAEISYKGESYRTNLRDWSDTACRLITQWLQNNDVALADSAEKTLKISIVSAEILPNRGFNRTYVQVMVETGDGVKKVFPAEAAANGYGRSAGYAIYHSVRKLIKEGTVSTYLSD